MTTHTLTPPSLELDSRTRGGRARVRMVRRLLNRIEWPLAMLALLVVPILILEDRTTNPSIRWLCSVINWFVWLAFLAEVGLQFSVAKRWRSFLRASWGNLLIILLSPPFLVPDALQTLRSVRALRLLRLLKLVRGGAVATIGLRTARRAMGSHGFPYVMVVAIVAIGLGAAAIYRVEQETVRSPEDALWWAVVTVTTVGYGDISPVSGEGRMVALRVTTLRSSSRHSMPVVSRCCLRICFATTSFLGRLGRTRIRKVSTRSIGASSMMSIGAPKCAKDVCHGRVVTFSCSTSSQAGSAGTCRSDTSSWSTSFG